MFTSHQNLSSGSISHCDKCPNIDSALSGRIGEIPPNELWGLIDVLEDRAAAALDAVSKITVHLISIDYQPPEEPAIYDTH